MLEVNNQSPLYNYHCNILCRMDRTKGISYHVWDKTRVGSVSASLSPQGALFGIRALYNKIHVTVPAFLKPILQYYFVMMMNESALVHCFQLMCNTCLHILWSQDTRAREGTALQLIHHSLKVWWDTGSIVLCYVKQWMQSKMKSNPYPIFYDLPLWMWCSQWKGVDTAL